MESPLVPPPWENDGGDGATPLSPEDRESLIPVHIAVRGELNELEAQGVLAAVAWAFTRRRSMSTLLKETFIRRLHKEMLGEVWTWAGTYRTRESNLGIDPALIQVELRKLLEDTRYWLEHETYPADEIAIRFHHRLVHIHPFPNGNGRLSRLMADLLSAAQDGERFTWGQSTLDAAEARKRYLAAVRAADQNDLAPLLTIARLP